MMWRWGLKLALFLCCCSVLTAQGTHPLLRNYNAKNGLPSSEVYDILQDREGYIWVSTDNGVARFNGYEFEKIGPKQGLTDPVIFYLFEDHRGWIWMYSFQDRVFIYRDGQVTLFPHSDLLKSYEAANPKVARWIFVDDQGILYVSKSGSGIAGIGPDGSCRAVSDSIAHGLQLWIHQGYHFLTAAYGFDPSFSGNGYDPIYDKYRGQKTPITITKSDSSSTVTFVPRLKYGGNHDLSRSNHLFFRAHDRCLIQFIGRLLLMDVNTGEPVQEIVYDDGAIISHLSSERHQMTFLGHDAGARGLSIYDRSDFRQDLSILNHPRLRILSDKTISHLLEDRQGGLWIGTIEDGIYYTPDPTLLLSYCTDPNIKTPRSLEVVNADSILIRNQDYSVYVIDQSKVATEIPQSAHPSNGHQLIYDRHQKRIYANGLLKVWSPEKNRWRFILKNGLSDKMASIAELNQCRHFSQSNYNSDLLWLGFSSTYNSVDVSQAPPRSSEVYDLIPKQRIFSLLETSHGKLYVGAMEGLYQHEAGGQARKIDHHEALNNRVESLVEMGDGTLVIGTKGGGVLLWNQDTTLQISVAQGLNSSAIEQLHVDDLQQLWVGTNSGLNRIRFKPDWTFQIESVTYADGLPSNEITDINSQGTELWIATVEGILSLPIDKSLNNGPVNPLIEEVHVNGFKRPITDLAALNWTEDNIRIAVTSFDFPQANNITYRYRFADDSPWQTTQSSRIEVAQLSPGHYDFEIQARGRNGKWSEATGFPLHLQNPFWKNVWFWLGMAAIGLMLIAWYYNRALRRQARQQEQNRQLLQLESEVNELRQQAYRAQMNPHFVYNCLTAIQSFMLSNESDQLLASDYLSKFAMLTRQALEASREKTISLEKDIQMLDNYILLEQFRFGHRFQYEIKVDPEVSTHDILIPALLIQPYIENAILYGLSEAKHDGQLNIHYALQDDQLCITITDNGPGIFQHQRQPSTLERKKTHRSAGLDISRKRIQNTGTSTHPGNVTIEELTVDGQIKGTQVQVYITVGE